MSSLVKDVSGCVGKPCLVAKQGRLRARGSELDLSGTPEPKAVIDFDKPGSPLGGNSTRPDFLVVGDSNLGHPSEQADPGFLAPIELSCGRSKSANKIKGQLQAGVDWLDRKLTVGHKPRLFPVYCGPIHKQVRKDLRKGGKIRFRGQEESPQILKSGQKLTEALR